MCSVNEGNCDCFPPPESKKKSTTCVKCNNPAIVCIRFNDSFCKDCFILYCIHKYRSTFGKSKIVRDGESVILGFSGGHGASAMLHLTKEGKSARAAKKLRYLPILIYIDDTNFVTTNKEMAAKIRDKVIEKMKKSELEYECIPLERMVTKEFLQSLDTLTSKEETIDILKRQLLAEIALERKCQKVLLGDSSTKLSINVVSNVVQGRGSQVAHSMKFDDSHMKDVTLIRPMRELTSKEIAMYNKITGIEVVATPSFSSKTPKHSSMQRLSESFVLSLQASFPSTCSTLFRSGEKLEAKLKDDGKSCALCANRLDTNMSACSALEAAEFSRQQTNCNTMESNNFLQSFCYACRNIMLGLDKSSENSRLPDFVQRNIQRDQATDGIQKYLLDENTD
ncbi:DgyrCDS9153 [Dimorphilus gyrociliatus]|uniref:Cytoplasmic tRNA 2-thiolation protein 2 n=1 Tax=Dimorphilus gyrociliatus TaxID=2664684 RepID=A0A7I8VW80_9ANNE|nr:DgyrCDS9153 [Dimorphilus gyrociliatus]